MTGFLIYFMALSLIHLFFCYFEMRVLRMITKPLILLSLSVFYAFHAKPVDPMVLIALICGLVGDVFLMLDDRFFLPGAFSFTVGHGFYIYAICARMQGDLKQHIITAAIALTAYIVIVGISSAKLEKHVENKSFKALMPTYLGIVAIVNVLAAFRSFAERHSDSVAYALAEQSTYAKGTLDASVLALSCLGHA